MPDTKCRVRLPFGEAEIAQKRYEDAEAEVERLKCCGNCTNHGIHHDPYGECTETCGTYPDYDKDETHDWPRDTYGDVHSHDRCHISTSHWTRMEAPLAQ